MKYVADQPCFIEGRFIKMGQTFEYDGPEGFSFHKVGAKPKPKNDERMMDMAIAEHAPWEAEKAQLLAEIDRLNQVVADQAQSVKNAHSTNPEKETLKQQINQLHGVIKEKNEVIKRLR